MSVLSAARSHRARSRDRRRDESGSNAVEFALIVPILAMLLLGIVTAGISYSNAIGATNAVREGARYGATANAATSPTWGQDVVARVRGTQFDDSASATAICVQLYKEGSPAVASHCDQGNGSVSPALSTSDAVFPAVPSGLANGTCVVRVLAARNYTIALGVFPSLGGTMKRGSVARYEQTSC